MGDVEMGRMHDAAFGQLDGSVAENDQLGRGAVEGALASIRLGWKSWFGALVWCIALPRLDLDTVGKRIKFNIYIYYITEVMTH